jgi:hypothetical protein
MNLSFTSNIFPTAWKIAEVVPHVKDGDSEVASNNRPISLLVTNSKICERIVFNQLSNYLEELNQLNQLICLLTGHILNAIDEKKVTVLVLLDLSKAFDSIDHDRLLRSQVAELWNLVKYTRMVSEQSYRTNASISDWR